MARSEAPASAKAVGNSYPLAYRHRASRRLYKVPAAFERRCIPPDCVVRRLHMPNMRPPHALSGGRLAALGATRGFTTGCWGHALHSPARRGRRRRHRVPRRGLRREHLRGRGQPPAPGALRPAPAVRAAGAMRAGRRRQQHRACDARPRVPTGAERRSHHFISSPEAATGAIAPS